MTPTAKTSLQVTSNPKRVICFVTNKFDKMPCMQMKLIKASLPSFKVPRQQSAIIKMCKKNNSSFMVLLYIEIKNGFWFSLHNFLGFFIFQD